MLARYPQLTSGHKTQRGVNAPLLWSTAVLGLFLAVLFTWLLPQVAGLALLGLWLLGLAIAALASGLLSLHHSLLSPQWGLLFVGQFLGVTAVFLFLVAA